jgi:hypothetical protein
MSIQLPDARQLSDEALRPYAFRGIELGYSELELAELPGLPSVSGPSHSFSQANLSETSVVTS